MLSNSPLWFSTIKGLFWVAMALFIWAFLDFVLRSFFEKLLSNVLVLGSSLLGLKLRTTNELSRVSDIMFRTSYFSVFRLLWFVSLFETCSSTLIVFSFWYISSSLLDLSRFPTLLVPLSPTPTGAHSWLSDRRCGSVPPTPSTCRSFLPWPPASPLLSEYFLYRQTSSPCPSTSETYRLFHKNLSTFVTEFSWSWVVKIWA